MKMILFRRILEARRKNHFSQAALLLSVFPGFALLPSRGNAAIRRHARERERRREKGEKRGDV